MPYISKASSNGIDFAQSVETQKGYNDSISYTLDNDQIVKISYDEFVMDDTDGDGTDDKIDLDGDGDIDDDDKIDHDNAIKALVYKINHDKDIGGKITAYNGMYELANDGSKILTSDPRHSKYDAADPYKDRYLVVESTSPGEKGSFEGKILINDDENPTAIKKHVIKNKNDSKIAKDDIHLEVFDDELTVKGGSLKPMLDNIKTTSGNNKFNIYKEKLDQFALTLADLSNSFIENDNGSYVFGQNAVELNKDSDHRVNTNLFKGSDVKSITFNKSVVYSLSQEKLDYLAQIQWKTDVDFDGTGENNSSFSEFYQATRVKVADDRENIIFKKESQSAVKESLQMSYDKLTKVDKDAEMIDLIKYQSAYQANAKMITVLDEMLKTLLGLKR